MTEKMSTGNRWYNPRGFLGNLGRRNKTQVQNEDETKLDESKKVFFISNKNGNCKKFNLYGDNSKEQKTNVDYVRYDETISLGYVAGFSEHKIIKFTYLLFKILLDINMLPIINKNKN